MDFLGGTRHHVAFGPGIAMMQGRSTPFRTGWLVRGLGVGFVSFRGKHGISADEFSSIPRVGEQRSECVHAHTG